MRVKQFAALTAAALLTAGCGGFADIPISESRSARGAENVLTENPISPLQDEPGSFFGDALTLGTGGGGEDAGAQLPVNKYLWRSSIETLSFLPLASTDPYGGVIVTDWGVTPESPDERFKVTAFITSAELKPQSLKVVVNKEARSAGGWVAAPVAGETARQLEDAILTRARQLRVESRDEG